MASLEAVEELELWKIHLALHLERGEVVWRVEHQPGHQAWETDLLGEELDLSQVLGHCELVLGWIRVAG